MFALPNIINTRGCWENSRQLCNLREAEGSYTKTPLDCSSYKNIPTKKNAIAYERKKKHNSLQGHPTRI